MKILNITPDFGFNGVAIKNESFMFPSGCEAHVKIKDFSSDDVTIICRIKSSDDIMKIFLATDALKRMECKNIGLFLPYLPYARQDRVMVQGEPLSIKVFANLINSQNYSKVTVFDAHSEVSLALINNCTPITNHNFVKDILKEEKDYVIISPDAGAYKKIFKLCQEIGYGGEIVCCNKLRDVSNGQIKSIKIDCDNLNGKDVYIIDDLCDAGGTFIGLSQELRKLNCGKINLIVSHGIFSKGEDILKPHIDKIYTTDSVKSIESSYIQQKNLTNLYYL